jgi:lysophospholipase L1-like esterase
MVKGILCFGNSNTWGYTPGTGERLEYSSRWTGILAQSLNGKYHIIEEGLNGRTIAWDDPTHDGRNGLKYLVPCLETNRPLDTVILLLGTNDLKNYFNGSIQDIADNMDKMIKIIKDGQYGSNSIPPKILLLSIPHILKINSRDSSFVNAREKSIKLTTKYRDIALNNHINFLDITATIKPSSIDGVHLSKGNHQKLAQLLIQKIKDIEKTYRKHFSNI